MKRRPVTERIAEIERHHLAEVDKQLHVDRLIEPEFLAQLRHVLRRGRARLTGQHICRIARSKMQQREVQQDDRQQRRMASASRRPT